MHLLSLILSSIIQILLAAILPFIWWLITARKQLSFFHWLGIRKPIITDKKKFISIFVGTILLYSCLSFLVIPLMLKGSTWQHLNLLDKEYRHSCPC